MIQPGDGFRALVVGPEELTAMEIQWDSPIPGAGSGAGDMSERIDELEELRRDGAITAEEYEAQRKRILDSI